MCGVQIIDTFPAFEEFWEKARSLPLATQIDLWEHDQMAAWPELLAKQKADYRKNGVDWKVIARTKVFPHLEERLPRMRRLHEGFVRDLPGAWSRTKKKLGIRFQANFVVYVGLGCGMGWATRYDDRPAVLFGLENAAENFTGEEDPWPGAISHELAHLAQYEWRRQHGVDKAPVKDHPLWQLYEEGFATQAEREIEGPRAFRLRTGDPNWLPWCESHRRWLAGKFIADVAARRTVRPYFGSWYKVQGHIETGYYLGAEVIREWRRSWSFERCAVVPEMDVRRLARRTLRDIADGGFDRGGVGEMVPAMLACSR